jgi:hypothetical protein
MKALALVLAACALAGCASPDYPTPRRPIVPQPVQDLEARQQGRAVVLSFTLPGQSTRREPLAEPPAIEIYRGALEAGGRPPERTATRLVYTIPGELAGSYQEGGRIVYRDAIEPGEVGLAPGGGRIYVVRTRAERNRASAESNRVVVRTYVPPEAVADVRAAVVERGIALEWAPAEPLDAETSSGPGEYRVYRAEIAPGSAAAAREDASKATLIAPLRLLGQAAETRYRDSDFEWGHAYLYVVRRVAQFGGDVVESGDSRPAVITPAEVSLPAVPQGLEAVVVPASAQEAAYVSLSWAISAEAGVAGYAVYRSDQPETPAVRLNASLLGAPTYRDSSVAPGRRYFYRVAAVDGAGQESAPSTAVEAQIPEAQP